MIRGHRPFRAAFLALCPVLAAAAPAGFEPLHVPVMRENFPDPHIIRHGRDYLGYATNRGVNLPMARSRDLVT